MSDNQLALIVLAGLCFILAGCTDLVQDSKTAWNVLNAGAYEALAEIEAQHQASVDAVVEDGKLSKEEKLAALDQVKATYHPAYVAYRTLRAVLSSARAVLTAAEAAQASGGNPDWGALRKALSEAVAAQKALAEAMP